MRKCFWLFLGFVLLGAAPQSEFPIVVHGSDEAAFSPIPLNSRPVADRRSYDVVVAGGGLAGLSAAVYLTDAGLKVLLLEKEKQLGGLAAGGSAGSIKWGRGASYWTRAYDEELKILEHIGLGDYQTRYPIHEPSDSYFHDGELFLGIWEHETLQRLHPSFDLFKIALENADSLGLIPNQPLEEAAKTDLDELTAAQWIRKMPLQVAALSSPEAKAAFQRLIADPRTDMSDPMKPVMELIEIYCRSALGAEPEHISAMVFANFYISEIETRYTTEIGTGGAAERMEKMLRSRRKAFLEVSATVTEISQKPKGVEVRWVKNGKLHSAKASYSVFALPLKFAPKILKGFEQLEPNRTKTLKALRYAHYNVHNLVVKGHPYRASYDTWTRARDYSQRDFADVILGRWMDPLIKGYEGMRDFQRSPSDDVGVISLYQPLPLSVVSRGYSEDSAKEEALYSVNRLLELYRPLLEENWGTKIEVERVETTRWPYSIHLAEPGHFKKSGRELRRPHGRVYFANNNIGTPTFEEALFRGHCAANNIRIRMQPRFVFETWTRCPREN